MGHQSCKSGAGTGDSKLESWRAGVTPLHSGKERRPVRLEKSAQRWQKAGVRLPREAWTQTPEFSVRWKPEGFGKGERSGLSYAKVTVAPAEGGVVGWEAGPSVLCLLAGVSFCRWALPAGKHGWCRRGRATEKPEVSVDVFGYNG